MRTLMAMTPNANEQDLGWLLRTALAMLRPIARLLVGRIDCNMATDLLRLAYIEAARDKARDTSSDGRVTKSALSLLTGLDTRMIDTVQSSMLPSQVGVSQVCPEAVLLDTWVRKFQDPDGTPANLPIHGPGASMQTLVRKTMGRAVTTVTAVERLVAMGNIQVSPDGNSVVLIKRHYAPVDSDEQTVIESGAAAVARVGEAVCHNIVAHKQGKPCLLQQDRWSSQIPPEDVDQLLLDIRNLVQDHIQQVENKLGAAEVEDGEAEKCSVGFGWFQWASGPKP